MYDLDDFEVFEDDKGIDPNIPVIKPLWVMHILGYQIPIYQKLNWIRRLIISICMGVRWERVYG